MPAANGPDLTRMPGSCVAAASGVDDGNNVHPDDTYHDGPDAARWTNAPGDPFP